AVVLAGPRKDLVADERAALSAYLDEGGALVALVDPGEFPEIAGLLGREGVGLGDEIVVDRLSKVFGADILVPVVTAYPETDVTRGFRLATMFPLARPVLFLSPAPRGAERSNVAATGPGSWGERDTHLLLAERKAVENRGVDREGPLALAVMTERPAGKGGGGGVGVGGLAFPDKH